MSSGNSSATAAAVVYRAGPGGGKTAYLLRQAREALAAGVSAGRVLWLAPDQAAAELVAARWPQASGGLAGCPQILTYEALARRVLEESGWGPGGEFLDPLTERLLVGRALRDTSTAARYFQVPAVRESPRFRDDVADFIAELKRHKVTPELLREQVLPRLRDAEALADLTDAYARYQELVQAAGVYDLRGLLWLATVAVQDPDLARSWQRRWALILADDLQDATALHLEL